MSPHIAKRRRIGDNAMEKDLIINKLPIHLISCILDRMPINDAARTSILSKAWKHLWLSRTLVNLRYPFIDQLVSKHDAQTHQSLISATVNNILLAIKPPIIIFCLFIPPNTNLQLYYNYWMSLLSTKGVKQLEVINGMPNPVIFMPSYFFSCSDLARLYLSNHRLDPPPNFGGFRNLTLVYLRNVTFYSDMSFGPQLNQLSLIHCLGIQHLGRQFTHHNKNLNKLQLLRFSIWEIAHALLLHQDIFSSVKDCINLHRFLSCTPNMATLVLDSFCLSYLDPQQLILTRLTTAMDQMKTLVLYHVEFYHFRHLPSMLFLIQSSPNLQTLKISVGNGNLVKRNDHVDLRVEQFLKSPDHRKFVLHQLHAVEISDAVGSRAEQLFIQLLLATSPSLKRLHLHRNKAKAPVVEDLL